MSNYHVFISNGAKEYRCSSPNIEEIFDFLETHHVRIITGEVNGHDRRQHILIETEGSIEPGEKISLGSIKQDLSEGCTIVFKTNGFDVSIKEYQDA